MNIERKNNIIYICLVIIFSVSCAREAYNISYNGVILDCESNLPIPQSSIQSFCLFQQNIDKSSTYTATTTTDSLGSFQLQFDKGYKITMVIEANDYAERFLQFKPKNTQLPDTIFLKRKVIYESSLSKPLSNFP